MSKKRTEYSESFKAEAITKIKDNNGNIIQTAKELGIPMNTLANWQRKANSGTLEGSSLTSREQRTQKTTQNRSRRTRNLK